MAGPNHVGGHIDGVSERARHHALHLGQEVLGLLEPETEGLGPESSALELGRARPSGALGSLGRAAEPSSLPATSWSPRPCARSPPDQRRPTWWPVSPGPTVLTVADVPTASRAWNPPRVQFSKTDQADERKGRRPALRIVAHDGSRAHRDRSRALGRCSCKPVYSANA